MFARLRKLKHDPIGFCLDSKFSQLRAVGFYLLQRQKKRLKHTAAAKQQTKLTVIMTAYNSAPYIRRAVMSVLNQTHGNFELLIIDDCSTDHTVKIAKQLAKSDSRIKLFVSSLNHGTYWSKNWCLTKAIGDYVTFHDSDDVSHPERFELQLAAMANNPNIVANVCRWSRVDTGGNVQIIDGRKDRLAVISLMIKREQVIRDVGYYDSVRIAADSEYLARLHLFYGNQSILNLRHNLYTGLVRTNALTRENGGGYHYSKLGGGEQRQLKGHRAAYHAGFEAWHAGFSLKTSDVYPKVYVDFPLNTRPFSIPEAIDARSEISDVVKVERVS